MSKLTLCENAAALLARWHEARGAAAVPSAKFIDPIKLRNWVGDISVVHLHDGDRRFYVALHGANVARHRGPDFHQKYLEDAVPPIALSETLAPYTQSIETKQPTYSVQRKSFESGLYQPLERMVLPCALEDPEQVGRFLVWVAPSESDTPKSDSSFSPLHETDAADLYILTKEYAA